MYRCFFENGMGNQMFMYAFVRKLQLENNEKVIYDISRFQNDAGEIREFELDNFAICSEWEKQPVSSEKKFFQFSFSGKVRYTCYLLVDRIYRFITKGNPYNRYNSAAIDHVYFNICNFLGVLKSVDGLGKNPGKCFFKEKFVIGGFFFPESAQAIESVLKDELRVVSPENELNASMRKRIEETESVGVHIRRGDFVTLGLVVCDLEYYKKSICEMLERLTRPVFYIFSDDIGWVRNNLCVDAELVYVDLNNSAPDDMRLLYNCKHFIISNSTFSWWGAFLGKYSNKMVVAPKYWRKDCSDAGMNLRDWIEIDNRLFHI